MLNTHIENGRKYIESSMSAMDGKLGSGQVELPQYITFMELCAKALSVLKELEQLQEDK